MGIDARHVTAAQCGFVVVLSLFSAQVFSRVTRVSFADVAAFMFLLLFAMIAMTSTLDELRLLTDTEAAYFPGGYQVPFATFFKVYDIAVFLRNCIRRRPAEPGFRVVTRARPKRSVHVM